MLVVVVIGIYVGSTQSMHYVLRDDALHDASSNASGILLPVLAALHAMQIVAALFHLTLWAAVSAQP
jgi:hypothetical protein